MDNSDVLEKKPPIEHPMEMLKQIQSDLDDIEAEHLEKRRKLENQYQRKFQPLYTTISEIVYCGLNFVLKSSYIPPEERGVPNFWLTAMKANEVVAVLIQKHDEDALRYLKDIKWCRIQVTEDMYPHPRATEGFKLEFIFDRNPYFKNSVLSKTYCMFDEDNVVIERAIGTTIEWFSGKCLTNKPHIMSKPSSGITKTILDSFFNFFNPAEMPEDADAEMVEYMISLMKPDYSAGLSVRDEIIPHSVCWFTKGNKAKVEKLPHTVLQNLKLLKKIKRKLDELEDMFVDSRNGLDAEYLNLCQPHFKKRYEIVNGVKSADEGEITSGKEIPNFWLTALKANKVVAKMIQKQDEQVLKYLKDIRCCIVSRGFKLEFVFSQNTYFKNALLTKSYFLIAEWCTAPSLEEFIGTEIEWLGDRNITAAGSFFNMFTLPKLPDCKDRDKVEEWISLMQLDYNVGLRIRKDVILHAVSMFEDVGGDQGGDHKSVH